MNTEDVYIPEVSKLLARSIRNGDFSAWEPLHDSLIEFGFPLVAQAHYTNPKCVGKNSKYCFLVYLLATFPDDKIKELLIDEEISLKLR